MGFRAINCQDCRRDIQISTDVAAPNFPNCDGRRRRSPAAYSAAPGAVGPSRRVLPAPHMVGRKRRGVNHGFNDPSKPPMNCCWRRRLPLPAPDAALMRHR